MTYLKDLHLKSINDIYSNRVIISKHSRGCVFQRKWNRLSGFTETQTKILAAVESRGDRVCSELSSSQHGLTHREINTRGLFWREPDASAQVGGCLGIVKFIMVI